MWMSPNVVLKKYKKFIFVFVIFLVSIMHAHLCVYVCVCVWERDGVEEAGIQLQE